MGKVLLFGPSGQVGKQFARQAAGRYRVEPAGRTTCDLADARAVYETIVRAAPAAIVNAAAYTAVDKAESDEAACFAVNAAAPAAMARSARELGIPLIHYSTDYVFNGEKLSPYVEDDPTGPLGVYGRSKLEGEQAIAAAGGEYLVLRTSWVYGSDGHNFLRTMLRLGAERQELKIVDDQIGAPTSAGQIAGATVKLLERDHRPAGVYHMTAAGSTSWCGFAERIFALANLPNQPKLTPIPTSAYPTPAKRPKNSVLSNDKFEKTFGFRLDPWEDALRAVMTDDSEDAI